MRVVGLMSGTSADGIDAALVEWPDDPTVQPFRLVAHSETPLPAELQERVHRLAAARVPGPEALAELVELDVLLGERFALACADLLARAGVEPGRVDAIGSHGQTVAHHPERRGTLQIGDPSVIAERTGIRTVADFRARDLAAGGEGAPLAPFFHHAVFSAPGEDRLALNLGGISNVTWLPASGAPGDVVAFDTGPANSLLDGVATILSGGSERMDRDGARARAGTPDADLLTELLDDAYLRRSPPKSTGRERYGRSEAEALAARAERDGIGGDDLLATLAAFTVAAVADASERFLGKPARVLVGGGGVRNPALMAGLADRFADSRVEPFDAAGVPADAAEAMAFSLLARNAVLGVVNHLPRTTGARRAVVLGEIVPGGAG